MTDLAPAEQEKLNEFQVITAFPEDQHDKVVALLRNNYWNLEMALSKYFDGRLEEEAAREPPQIQEEAPPVRERPAQHQRLADFMEMEFQGGHHLLMPQLPIVRPISNRWKIQPGITTQNDHFGLQTFAQSPLIFVLLLIPRTLTFILAGLGYLFNFLFPPSPNMIPSSPTMPTFYPWAHYETVTRDKCPFEFYKGDFNEAFNECKRESRFMLLLLIGDNEASTTFIKRVLNNEAVAQLIETEDIVVFMSHVGSPQGHEITKTMRTRAVPSAYLLANVASGPSGVSSMSLCARLSVKTVNPFLSKLRDEVEHYKPELITKRIEQEELEYARKIREMQDRAYEESLIADRIKREQKEEEEKRKLEKVEKKQWEKEQRKLFYASILKKFDGLEELAKGEFTTVRFRLPSGEGIMQRFSEDHSLFDVYSFIDLKLHLKELSEEGMAELESFKEVSIDDDYKHVFNFELTSPYPRYTVPVDQEKSVKDTNQLWPNGSVMLEFFEESDEEDKGDEE